MAWEKTHWTTVPLRPSDLMHDLEAGHPPSEKESQNLEDLVSKCLRSQILSTTVKPQCHTSNKGLCS
jgi:hypothetical protein